MPAQCVNTATTFTLPKRKFSATQVAGRQGVFKEAWLSNENSINKCIELPQAGSVLRPAISWWSVQSTADQYNRLTINTTSWAELRNIFFKNFKNCSVFFFTFSEDGLKDKTETSTWISLPNPRVLLFHLVFLDSWLAMWNEAWKIIYAALVLLNSYWPRLQISN